MEENEIVLGRVSLNAYTIDEPNRPTPVIELLAHSGASEGELVVMRVLRKNDRHWEETEFAEEVEIPASIKNELMKRIKEAQDGKTVTSAELKEILFPKKK